MASQALDSSAEILEIEGLDISDFDEGRGLANWEHQGHDSGETQGQEVVGKVVYSHKIFKESDCTNDRERMFWKRVKLPFLYGVVRLFDGAGHEGAKAIAAIVRDSYANDEPIAVGFSIEGSTLEKDKDTNHLKRTIAKRVAITCRPCNKQAISGLLADPNAPEGFSKKPVDSDLLAMVSSKEEVKKSGLEDPNFTRLGGSQAIYGASFARGAEDDAELQKAMIAGNVNVAPGARTGGAALQREDIGLRERVHAVFRKYRDGDRKKSFKDTLKAELPDVSDEFVDHYADVVDRHILRVKKAAEVVLDLKKAGQLPKSLPTPTPPSDALTVQGVPVPPGAPQGRTAWLDERGATLHTTRGAFQLSSPSSPHPNLTAHAASKGVSRDDIRANFHQALDEARPSWLNAMKSWLPMNERYLRGDYSPELVSHAVAFALMSPGIKVPMQEAMYGHLVDTMHEHGMDAIRNQADLDKVKGAWLGRSGTGWPQHSADHFRRVEEELRSRFYKPEEGRWGGSHVFDSAGTFMGHNKPNVFLRFYGDYLSNHRDAVIKSLQEAKGDSSTAVRRLDEVNGFAPKLARYTLGMLGAGDMTVPDTHFIRHSFAFRPGAPGSKGGLDERSQKWVTGTFDKKEGQNILDGIDRWYDNHDSVRRVLADPAVGPYFAGKERQARFPAFWWHWISVPRHENLIGTPNENALNIGTDHAPFWQAVAPFMKKSEDGVYDPELPVRTAMQHHRWSEMYGPVQALRLYFSHLVPKLLANEEAGRAVQMRKTEELVVDLMKGLIGNVDALAKPVTYKKAPVLPGQGVLNNNTIDLLEVQPKKVAYRADATSKVKTASRSKVDVRLFPVNQGVSSFVTTPEHLVEPHVHEASKHIGVGLDLGGDITRPDTGASDYTYWMKHPEHGRVFVKGEGGVDLFDHPFASAMTDVRAEATFHNLALDFFGLGHYLPPVALVRHPATGQGFAVLGHASGEHIGDYSATKNKRNYGSETLAELEKSGELDKLQTMDFVLGNTDRHIYNFLVDDDKKKLWLIDHGLAFGSPRHRGSLPEYFNASHEETEANENAHPDAVSWALKLDPSELDKHMRAQEVPEELIKGARRRLLAWQAVHRSWPRSRNQMWSDAGELARLPESDILKYNGGT